MFLDLVEIKERLRRGDLEIDPSPDDEGIGPVGIDLHLGTQFRRDPSSTEHYPFDPSSPVPPGPSNEKWEFDDVPCGNKLVIPAGKSLIATTLEYLYMPPDLAGFLFPRASIEILGLTVSGGSTVDPGFRGKLVVRLHNTTSMPFIVYPGLRVVQLCLTQLAHSSDEYLGLTMYQGKTVDSIEATREKKVSSEYSSDYVAASAASSTLAERLAEVRSGDENRKGTLLEEITTDLFLSLDGLSILKRNARLKAEEIDLIIKNDLNEAFWRIAGSPLVVECKNWSGKVGAREISVLVEKLKAIGPDAKTGILIALNGITGNSYSDAILKIREARQRGYYLLVLEHGDLEEVCRGFSLARMIERKYEEVLLI